MDFNWFFRSGRKDSRRPDLFSDEDGIEQHEKDEKNTPFGFPIIDPFGNLEDTSHDLFKKMEDMFNQMFTSQFNSFGSIQFGENAPNDTDPRSFMLKKPGCENYEQYPIIESFEGLNPNQLVDSDIDDEVAKHGLVLDTWTPKEKTPQSYSYKKFSSTRTIRLPDGTLEEHRSVTDNQGNTTTTIRRSIGDQTYEVTTREDGHGIKEKQENLTNLDENELSDFEKRWKDIKSRNVYLPSENSNTESMVPKVTTPIGDPSYKSLFRKFFGF